MKAYRKLATHALMVLAIVFELLICKGFISGINAQEAPVALPQKQFNVLMIAVDDLRPVGSAFGENEVLMPNLDALAQRSTIFRNAYVQVATCGASRSSVLTGRRPDTTQVLSNALCPFTTQPEHEAWQSLPEYFAHHGYQTHGFGKIFHPNICDGAAVGERKKAWTAQPYYHAPCISLGSIYNHTCYESWPGPLPAGSGGKVTSVFANATVNSGADMPDTMIADHTIQTLESLSLKQQAGNAQPFFVATGFHKPHLPHIAPKKFFELYPLENVSLPSAATRHTPRNLPQFLVCCENALICTADVWNSCGEFKSYHDVSTVCKKQKFDESTPLDDDTTRRQRQAYFAAASYTDSQIGRLLDTLDTTGLAETTVVALWGDHGWHVGENNQWAKHTAMTFANRAPLLFALPKHKSDLNSATQNYAISQGKVISKGFAEFVDIYPTLSELAGLPVPPQCATSEESLKAVNCTEGISLASIVTGQSPAVGKSAAFGQWPRQRMGYNLYTTIPADLDPGETQVRYTEWVKYNKSTHGPIWEKNTSGYAELYNHTNDPDENVNIANDGTLKAILAALSKQLHEGWRSQ